MNRWFALAGVFGALIVAAAAGLWFLFATEAGARWLLGHAGEPLQYGELNGTLARGLTLSELRYTQDDLSIATQSVRLKAAVGWTGITIRDARVEGLRVATSSAGGDACAGCETDVRALLEDLALPIAVRLDALEIVRASLSSDEREVFALDRLFLAGVWNDALALDRFELESPLADAAGGGRLDLREPHALDLELDAVLAPALTGMPAAADVDLDVDGTLDELLLSASSRAVGAELEARLLTLPDDPRWEVDLRVADFESPPGQGVPVTIERLDLRSAGSFGEYSVDVTASLARPEPVRIALSGLGARNRLTIRRLEAVHADGNLAADGLLVFPESLELAISAAEVSPQRWLTAWPGDRAVRGSANLYLDAGALRIERGSLSVAGAPLAAEFTAAYSLDTEAISFALDWRDLAWPLDAEATLGSPRGQARIDGRPDGWTASAALGVVAPGVPDGALSLAASGDRTTAVVEIEDGRILGGAIGGEARFEAGEAPAWQIDVNAQGIDTQALFADWPGTLSVAIAGRGSPQETTLTLERLSGRLLDMPLFGEGFIAYRDGELHARDVALTHGEAHVRLDGSPGAGDGLAFEFGLPELDVYPLVIGGDLAGRGRLRLTGGDALIEVDADGTALRVAGVEAEALRITTSRADADAAIGLSVAAARIVAGDRAVDDLRLELGYADTEQNARTRLRVRPLRGRRARKRCLRRSGSAARIDVERGPEPLRRYVRRRARYLAACVGADHGIRRGRPGRTPVSDRQRSRRTLRGDRLVRGGWHRRVDGAHQHPDRSRQPVGRHRVYLRTTLVRRTRLAPARRTCKRHGRGRVHADGRRRGQPRLCGDGGIDGSRRTRIRHRWRRPAIRKAQPAPGGQRLAACRPRAAGHRGRRPRRGSRVARGRGKRYRVSRGLRPGRRAPGGQARSSFRRRGHGRRSGAFGPGAARRCIGAVRAARHNSRGGRSRIERRSGRQHRSGRRFSGRRGPLPVSRRRRGVHRAQHSSTSASRARNWRLSICRTSGRRPMRISR